MYGGAVPGGYRNTPSWLFIAETHSQGSECVTLDTTRSPIAPQIIEGPV